MDQLREGHIVYIKRIDPNYCPVNWLIQYLNNTHLISNEENFVISRLAKSKAGHNAHGSLACTRAPEMGRASTRSML